MNSNQLPALIMVPFAVMLLSIALMPLILKHHWERHYHQLSMGLAAITAFYYLFALRNGMRILHELGGYISFMTVVGSLFVVAGGIYIRTHGEARPRFNCAFLLFGTLLSSVLGTTGASMLLIRPWIRMNKYRYTGLHTAFFIFLVSNAGGCLSPVSPPLLLGFIKGVPFFWWAQHCWKGWAIAVAALVGLFYLADRINFAKAPVQVREIETQPHPWKIEGLRNLWFLLVILVALFVSQPVFLREALMIAAAAGSYLATPKSIHESNDFTLAPIKEVGWLFLGIFITMVPVVDYMQARAAALGVDTGMKFYWLTGGLSSVLDNAPTFLAFMANALGRCGWSIENPHHVSQFSAAHTGYLAAISLGASLFGAATYIGNGPNLMVKSIADHARVHTPSFFGYIFKFALPVLLPVLYLVSLLAF